MRIKREIAVVSTKGHDLMRLALLLCVMFVVTVPSSAQFTLKKKKKETIDTLNVKERFAFRTNGVEWLMLVPNLAVEFDLGKTNYNHYTIGLSGRYNWHTNPKLKSYNVFNVAEGRIEVRNYWHTRTKNGGYSNIFEYMTSRERHNPRYWRAYYLGGYAAAGTFSFKFAKEGYQGREANAGVTFGGIIPMYTYKKSFLDLELGASIGALYYDYDKYRLDRESNCYVRTSSKKGFLMYPVVTDLRVAMVYRYGHSVKNKYKFDQVKQLARVEAKTIYNKHRQEQRDSVNAAREKERKIKLAAKAEKATADSIAKATAKAEKAAKDSLAREQAKSAKAEKQANEKAMRDKANAEKQSKKSAKNEAVKEERAKKSEKKEKAVKEKAEPKKKAEKEKKSSKDKEKVDEYADKIAKAEKQDEAARKKAEKIAKKQAEKDAYEQKQLEKKQAADEAKAEKKSKKKK